MKYGNESGVYAEVIADTIAPNGARLTTMEVQCHRFVLAEFNTHRAFSRNSASSRAIPVAKMLERVRTNPALPLRWPAEQKGMQGGDDLASEGLLVVQRIWEQAARQAASSAANLHERGLHKSVTNRLLEPFLWHRIIVTSTEWQNFFDQRCSPLAQPEIRAAAVCMRDALGGSNPRRITHDWQMHWHLPYVDDATIDELADRDGVEFTDALKVSAARCARVSYLTHDGTRDLQVDIDLFDRLVAAEPPHWSPLEHVARPLQEGEVSRGNFAGWQQLRHVADAVFPPGQQSGGDPS